jgi:hypothetical protein
VVECLPSKHENLHSNPKTVNKKKRKKKKIQRIEEQIELYHGSLARTISLSMENSKGQTKDSMKKET